MVVCPGEVVVTVVRLSPVVLVPVTGKLVIPGAIVVIETSEPSPGAVVVTRSELPGGKSPVVSVRLARLEKPIPKFVLDEDDENAFAVDNAKVELTLPMLKVALLAAVAVPEAYGFEKLPLDSARSAGLVLSRNVVTGVTRFVRPVFSVVVAG